MSDSQKQPLLPAYLVVGDDALKKEAVMKRMRIRLEELGDLSFNSDTFNGETAVGEDIVTACATLPFASEKRLVVVQAADKLKKADSEPLIEYLSNPADTTVLLLLANSLARTTRLYKAVEGVGKNAVIQCARPQKKDLVTHVRNMAPAHGITLSDAAAAALVELLGDDTVHIDKELEKLALSQPANTAISPDQIYQSVSRQSEAKPWDFTDAFAARDIPKALAVKNNMPSMSAFGLLGMCTTRIRELLCAKTVLAGGGTLARVASELGVPDWKVKHLGSWAQRYSAEELRGALSSAVTCERHMKSGADADTAFVTWLLSVMSGKRV